jgi:hypothetical protein
MSLRRTDYNMVVAYLQAIPRTLYTTDMFCSRFQFLRCEWKQWSLFRAKHNIPVRKFYTVISHTSILKSIRSLSFLVTRIRKRTGAAVLKASLYRVQALLPATKISVFLYTRRPVEWVSSVGQFNISKCACCFVWVRNDRFRICENRVLKSISQKEINRRMEKCVTRSLISCAVYQPVSRPL